VALETATAAAAAAAVQLLVISSALELRQATPCILLLQLSGSCCALKHTTNIFSFVQQRAAAAADMWRNYATLLRCRLSAALFLL
jgi:hypothetical protein